VTPTRTEIIILATRTQSVLGEKGRRIRELTAVVQKRFNFPEGTVEVSFWLSTLRIADWKSETPQLFCFREYSLQTRRCPSFNSPSLVNECFQNEMLHLYWWLVTGPATRIAIGENPLKRSKSLSSFVISPGIDCVEVISMSCHRDARLYYVSLRFIILFYMYLQLYAEKVNNRGLCAIAQCESLRYKLLGGLAVRRACYGVLRFIMESGAKGCEVVVSGKLRGESCCQRELLGLQNLIIAQFKVG